MNRNLWIIALAALLVIGGYEAFLRGVRPGGDTGQDQFATNQIRLENYVDRNQPADGVVVGSSLTARVPADAWPEGWITLSQSGGNALVGLEVIQKPTIQPRMVLIEINTLDLGYRKEDSEAVLSPLRQAIRQLFWFTRTTNRPPSVLARHFRSHSEAVRDEAYAGFSFQLARQHQNYNKGVGAELENNLRHAKMLVDRLRHRGVKVVFFEMPVDRSLVGLLRARQIRHAAAAIFPPQLYCWLSVGDGRMWQTVDGIHLTSESARDIATEIVAKYLETACQSWEDR